MNPGTASPQCDLPPGPIARVLSGAGKRLSTALGFSLILAPRVVPAVCFPYPLPGYLEELEVESCTPLDEDAMLQKAKARGRSPDDSPEIYVRKLLTEHPGVLVSARVLRKRLLSPEQTDISGKRKSRAGVSPWVESGEVRSYFQASGSPMACEEFKPGHKQQRFVQELCCDHEPPTSVACLLGINEFRAVPEWAERLLQRKR